MTKLTFQMTADEFYEGWKYKLKKNNYKNRLPIMIIILIILIIVTIAITKSTMFLLYLFFIIALMVSARVMNKKAVKRQFFSSPTIKGEATLSTYGDGLEIINSYQKIFVPWQSIFSVKETEKLLIIMPTYRTGVFVISKERYSSNELNEIILLLKQNTTVEEGKR